MKAGNTKLKGTSKNSAIGANIRYSGFNLSKKGYRLKGQISGTKTSQSEMDSNIVVVDGKVRTPKEYKHFYAAWLLRNIESTQKNIWNFLKPKINNLEKKEIKLMRRLKAHLIHK